MSGLLAQPLRGRRRAHFAPDVKGGRGADGSDGSDSDDDEGSNGESDGDSEDVVQITPHKSKHPASQTTTRSARQAQPSPPQQRQQAQAHKQQAPPPPPQPQQESSVISEIVQVLKNVFQGMADAFAWHIAFVTMWRSKEIRRRARDCFILNGIIFLGSLAFFSYILLPTFKWMLSDPFLIFTMPSAVAPLGQHSMGAGSGAANETHASRFVQQLFDAILFAIYNIFWVFPVYCLSFILNGMWHQEIADEAYKARDGSPVKIQTSLDQIVKKVADEIHRMILFMIFLVQTSVVYVVPTLGPAFSFVCICWLYAFYCFEYKWVNKGWDLETRLDYLENHWAYFAGFGAPFTLFTVYFPQFVSGGVFALLFPMYIIMAMEAVPLRVSNELSIVPKRLPIFSISRRAAVLLIRYLKINQQPPPLPARPSRSK